MKKRSDKFIALLLCAFMAFSLIAAAADVPVEPCAECNYTEGHSDTCSQYVAPVDPETPADPEPSTEPETPVDPEPSTEPETPADPEPSTEPETPADPVPSTEPETPADPEPSTEPETPVDPEPSTEPEEPVTLEPASLNGDAAGMNFTVAGDLPENSKLQVKAIDVSCNDYIVGNYLSDVELPQGVAMAFELSILIVEEQDGVKQETPYVPTAANKLTVSVSGSKEDCFSAMSAYHLPGVTAKQVETVVKALAEGEVIPEDLPAAQPAALDADGNPLRYYNQMNVEACGDNGSDGKKIFSFPADGLSVFYLVAEVGSEHTDGCPGADCTIESCPCQCHSFYARLMACTTIEELDALVKNMTEEDFADLTENQLKNIGGHIDSLFGEYVQVENNRDTAVPGDETTPGASEVVLPTFDYTYAAPFGAPVVGQAPRKSLFSSRIARFANDEEAPTEPDNGVEKNKTFDWNENSTTDGTITLETWATGEYTQSTVTEEVATDIILVLDQSGSMADGFDTVTTNNFKAMDNTNVQNYPLRNNGGSGNIWYKLDDGYVRVYMHLTQDTGVTYNQVQRFGLSNKPDNSKCVQYSNENRLYQLLDDGTYARITVVGVDHIVGDRYREYIYYYADGTSETVSIGSSPTKVPLDRFFYTDDQVSNTYTYYYEAEDGTEVEIEKSVGDNNKPAKTYYSMSTVTTDRSKLGALTDAVTNFANSVAQKASATGVNHRIAVVGFASGNSWNGQSYNYGNTEVFIGAAQYKYGKDAQSVYASALMDMNTNLGAEKVQQSIGALDANGGTLTNLGLEMANGIFDKNPIAAGEKRNRVVIVFTDGQPGWSGYDSTTASSAVTQASTSKNTYGATVYSVGIFEGANVNGTDRTNQFMRDLSSGTGYYLTASNADALNKIFQSISHNIESGGSTTKLASETIVRDVISDSFRLPENADTSSIKVYTQGVDPVTGEFTGTPVVFTDAVVNVDTANQSVTVTNFDFSANWVGPRTVNGNTTYAGKKLIIEIPVKVRDGFLGGNNVPTNNPGSGIYENTQKMENGESVEDFVSPNTDVIIKPVTITAEDKNVYLLGDLTTDQFLENAEIKCGDVVLDLSADATNYGLESWQNAFVTIESGDQSGLTDLTEDTEYTISCTVSPKTTGTVTAQTKEAKAAVNVYLPEVTFIDDEASYGGEVPTLTDNASEVLWKHGTTSSTDQGVTMNGDKPAVSLTYSLPDDAVSSNKIVAITDIPVNATAKIDDTAIDQYITYKWTACADDTADSIAEHKGNVESPEFYIHITAGTLTIKKTGDVTANEGFIFHVTCPDGKRITVSVPGNGEVTITGLPLGEYTIVEDSNWSWRYEDRQGTVTLSKGNINGEITFQNKKDNPNLLDGNAYVQNISKPAVAGN